MTIESSTEQLVVLSLTLGIFNVATLWLIKMDLANVNIGSALSEKRPEVVEARAKMIEANTNMLKEKAKALAEAGAPQAQQARDAVARAANEPAGEAQSTSRVVGVVGGIVLATFVWAVANIIIYKAFRNPADIGTFLTSIGTFIWSGSALFAPYAFNQLATIFDMRNRNA